MMKGLGLFNPKLIHKLGTAFTYVGERANIEKGVIWIHRSMSPPTPV